MKLDFRHQIMLVLTCYYAMSNMFIIEKINYKSDSHTVFDLGNLLKQRITGKEI